MSTTVLFTNLINSNNIQNNQNIFVKYTKENEKQIKINLINIEFNEQKQALVKIRPIFDGLIVMNITDKNENYLNSKNIKEHINFHGFLIAEGIIKLNGIDVKIGRNYMGKNSKILFWKFASNLLKRENILFILTVAQTVYINSLFKLKM
uniref:Uncharacterized protein n=1 Tax=Meloidogyne incognita TaxID=6306 RepID=A0A914LWH9_MELIC